jgi:hypothetical protein
MFRQGQESFGCDGGEHVEPGGTAGGEERGEHPRCGGQQHIQHELPAWDGYRRAPVPPTALASAALG